MIVGIVLIAMIVIMAIMAAIVIGMAACGDTDGACERLYLALNIVGAMGAVLSLVGLAAAFILA